MNPFEKFKKVEAGVTVFVKEKSVWQISHDLELPVHESSGVVIDSDGQLCIVGPSTALRALARALDREARAVEYRAAQLDKGRR